MNLLNKEIKKLPGYPFDRLRSLLANTYANGEVLDMSIGQPMHKVPDFIRDIIFNIGDEVDYVKEDIQGKVVRRSTNYIVVEDTNNNLHKAWIWDCIPISKNREAEMRDSQRHGKTAVRKHISARGLKMYKIG